MIRLGKIVRSALYLKFALLIVVIISLGVIYARLSYGALSLPSFSKQVATSLEARLEKDWRVEVQETALALGDDGLAVHITGLDVRNPQGVLVIRSPDAIVNFRIGSLFLGRLQPSAIALQDVQLRAALGRNGVIAISPTEDEKTTPETVQQYPEHPVLFSDRFAHATSSLLNVLLNENGFMGDLEQASLRNARLTFVDDQRREKVAFQNVTATFIQKDTSSRHFDLSLTSANGPWQITGAAGKQSNSIQAGLQGKLNVQAIPLQDIVLLSGFSGFANVGKMMLNGQASLSVNAEQQLDMFNFALKGQNGVLKIYDNLLPLLPIENIDLNGSWQPQTQSLLFEKIGFNGAGNRIHLSGTWQEKPDPFEPWQLDLKGKNAQLAGVTPQDPPVIIDEIDLSLTGGGQGDGIALQKAHLRGPGLGIAVVGSWATSEDQGGLRIGVNANQTLVRSAIRIWPSFVSPKVREYLTDNLHQGIVDRMTLSVFMNENLLKQVMADGALDAQNLQIDFDISQAELSYAKMLPPVTKARVSGKVDGKSAMISASQGLLQLQEGRTLNVEALTFAVTDFWSHPTMAHVGFNLRGAAEGLASFLQMPAFHSSLGIEVTPEKVKGQADVRVNLSLPLDQPPAFRDIDLQAKGVLSNFSVDKIAGKEKLENANVTFGFDGTGLTVKGEGKMNGNPASLEAQQPKGGGGDAVISFILDDAARAKRGMAFGSQLTGPVPLKISLPLGKANRQGAKIEADLTKTAIDDLLPGWNKAAGRPAKLSLSLNDNGRDMRDIVLESGSVVIKGNASLTEDGALVSADFSTFRLSLGDDFKVQIERSNEVYRATIRGPVADVRPFLKLSSNKKSGKSTLKDFDVDLGINVLTGFNNEALTNATLKMSHRNNELRQLQLNGRFGADQVTGSLKNGSNFLLQAENAGATLRFTDLYRRLVGGDLTLQSNLGRSQEGTLIIRNFTLRNEPALSRILAQQPPPPSSDRMSGQLQPMAGGEVAFTKLKADFARTNNRLDLQDMAMWGPSAGFTLKGFIDYNANRTDITGTFVPIYGLNNAFAQVPLFGPILGGGQNEGLFAINFRVSGLASAPILTVNPLSVMVPGILRKLFEAGRSEDSNKPPSIQ